MNQNSDPSFERNLEGAGRCLCGGVSYEVTGPLRPVWNCHCFRCRQTSGHHVAATGCAPEHLHMTRSETLKWYEPAAGVYYGFCTECGSSLFFKTDEGSTTNISIMAGTLSQPTGLVTSADWWTSEVADYHQLRLDTIHHSHDG